MALPAVIIVYALNPLYVPAAFAAVGGGHFLPYAWLHRTSVYIYLGVAVSLGSFAMMAVWGAAAFPFIPLFWSGAYWITAFIVRSVARKRAAFT